MNIHGTRPWTIQDTEWYKLVQDKIDAKERLTDNKLSTPALIRESIERLRCYRLGQ